MTLPAPAVAIIHVAIGNAQADDRNPGTSTAPLRTIAAAARRAEAGDTVLIHPGIYRETVRPERGGEAGKPITYRAEVPGSVLITGGGPWIPIWQALGHDLHAAALLPVAQEIFSDVLKDVTGSRCRGQLLHDGMLLRQALDEDELQRCPGTWRVRDHGRTLVLHAAGAPPSTASWELIVRDVLWCPARRGLGHLHLIDLTFAYCANRPAGGFWEKGGTQQGAVTTAAGHHWQIRGCTIRDAVSIGLDIGSGGARESDGSPQVPEVGHHRIIDNLIVDNGQCGICGIGHRGVQLLGNRVLRNNRLGYGQAEEAGIKLHFVFDALIAGNIVEDNDGNGIWLDNQWYGTRITGNYVARNRGAGIFVEMGDGPCLVDTNVVVETRTGDGIYTHDASGVQVAHNLLIANAHFGIYMRTVTERIVGAATGGDTTVATCRQNIHGNVFIDNYRGHVCLPLPGERDHDNRCDENLYLNGGQWQWEGLPFHRFVIGCDDGRITQEQITAALAGRSAVRGNDGSAQTDLATWQALGGWDLSSVAPVAHRGAVENGAVAKGSLSLNSQDRCLIVTHVRLLDAFRIAPPPELTTDYHGRPLPAAGALPGPFQQLAAGPLSLTPGRHNG